MKLPASVKGFTLIELMVVIAIIAILAVVGFSVYAGAQGNARDATRISELASVATSIEASRNVITGVYKYTTADGTADFPRGFPPTNTQSIFCIATSTSTGISTADPTTNWTTTCPATPTGYGPLSGASSSMSTTTTGNLGATTADVKSWKVCAALERGTAFCKRSIF